MLRRTVREFAEAEIAPHRMEYDESQEFPREIVRKAAELGLYGVIFPEQYGGEGVGYVDYVIVVEEVSRVEGWNGNWVGARNSVCKNDSYRYGEEVAELKLL